METYSLNLAALAEVAAVPRTLAQNWTTGRPLRVTPSVSRAAGRGTQNLYSMEDAYVIALLFELSKNGVSTEHVALAYQGMNTYKPDGAKSLVSREYRGITFDDQDGSIGIFPTPICEPRIRVLPGAWSGSAESGISTTYHVINLVNLLDAVDQRAEAYWKRKAMARRGSARKRPERKGPSKRPAARRTKA